MADPTLAMEWDSESQGVFGNLLGKRPLQFDLEPTQTKFRQWGGKGQQGGRGGGRQQQPRRGQKDRSAAPAQGSRINASDNQNGRPGPSSTSSADHALLPKALIVQSDYLARLQCDHTVIFTFRNGNGPQLMVPLLHEVADNWRAQRLKKARCRDPSKLTLLQYLVAEIITRVTAFATDKQAQTQAQEMGWITSDMEYNFLDWNAEEQKLVPRQEGTLTQDQILADARRMKTILKEPELILRFGGGRNAQPDSQSETATFVLELSLQCPAAAEGDGDLPEVVRKLRAPPSVATPQAGPPGPVAVDQGDSGGGRLVKGRGPQSCVHSCLPCFFGASKS